MLTIIAKAFISKAFAGAGVLTLNFLLAHFYGLESVGYFMHNLSLIVGMSLITRFGMDNALVRDLSIHYERKEHIEYWNCVLTSFLWCFASSVILIISLLFSARAFEQHVSLPILLALPIYSFIYLQSSMLKSVGLVTIAPVFETGSVAAVVSFLVIVFQGIGETTSILYVEWSFLLAATLVFILGFALLILKFFHIEKRKFHYLLIKPQILPWKKYNGLGSFWVLSINSYVGQWGVILLLGYYLNSADLGAFTLAHRASLLISFILIVINGVVSPKFAYYYAANNKPAIQHLVSKIFWIGAGMACIAYCTLIIAGQQILNLLITNSYHVYSILMILALAQVINVITGPSTYLMMMTRNEQLLKKYMIFFTSVTLVLIAFFAKSTGVIGASIALAVVESLKNTILVFIVFKTLSIKIIPFGKI